VAPLLVGNEGTQGTQGMMQSTNNPHCPMIIIIGCDQFKSVADRHVHAACSIIGNQGTQGQGMMLIYDYSLDHGGSVLIELCC
jgi:hypothetical protein